jgi:hypothetical protein
MGITRITDKELVLAAEVGKLREEIEKLKTAIRAARGILADQDGQPCSDTIGSSMSDHPEDDMDDMEAFYYKPFLHKV